MLDAHRLRVFRSVVATGSVTASAAALGYTPSTVSQHINALQRETGVQLFEKAGRGIAPTPIGLELAEASGPVMEHLTAVERLVSAHRDGVTSSLRIECFASAAQAWLPELLAYLRHEHPDVVMYVRSAEYLTEPGQSDCDLVLMTRDPGDIALPSNDFRTELLLTEGYNAVLPAGHHLLQHTSLRMNQLADVPWINNDFEISCCGRIIERACTTAGFTPNYVAHVSEMHTAMAMVVAGLGITVIPHLAAQTAPPGAIAVPIVEPGLRRDIVVSVKRTAAQRPPVQSALDALRRLAAAEPSG